MKTRQLLITLLVLIIFMRIQQTYAYIQTDYTLTYEKIWWWELTQDLVKYAYEVSDWDLDFIHTIECENWMREPLRQSNVIDKNWYRETSYGLCQRNTRWHSAIVRDPNFSDPYWQIDTCWDMYSSWKEKNLIPYRLYGYNNRKVCATHFERVIDINYYLQPRYEHQSARKTMVDYIRNWLSRL